MKRALSTLSFITVLASTLFGTQVGAQNIYVKYGYDCSHWSDARKRSYDPNPIQGYLVGFLDATALRSGKDIWMSGGGLEDRQVFFWMDRYCDRKPLDNLIQGAFGLMTERFGKDWHR